MSYDRDPSGQEISYEAHYCRHGVPLGEDCVACNSDPRDRTDAKDTKPSSVRSVRSVPSDWESPSQLRTHGKLPAFPIEVFPNWLQDHVRDVAHYTQTPPDLPATVALAVLATAIGGRVKVRARRGWEEPTNIFTVTSLPPGSRKSAVFAKMTRPLIDAEKQLQGQIGPKILEAETLLKITQSEAKQKAQQAAKAEGEKRGKLRDEAVALEQVLAELFGEMPPPPRLFADDITPEAASSLLARQKGRLGVLSAEGGIFSIVAGRYSGGVPNMDIFLKGHAGDALRVDRKGSSSSVVDEPALTLGLTVQPEVLRQIAQMPGFRGRGLLARILYSLPVNTVGHRQTGIEPTSIEVENRYEVFLCDLATSIYQWTETVTLELEPEAQALIKRLEGEIEPRLRDGGELHPIVDWASKWVGAVLRIAGLLHIAEHLGGMAEPVRVETVERAVLVGRYFRDHALAAFAEMGADPLVEDALYVLAWIEREQVTEFTRRDAHRGCRRFKKVADLVPVLELLEDHGYIHRREIPEQKGPGRPPAPMYDVNPLISKEVSS
jgi:replicative DNA helicase